MLPEIKFFKVEAVLLQSIANYLSERPFKEVAHLINEMQKATPIEFAKPVESEPGSAQC
jgi:hypothetical protein